MRGVKEAHLDVNEAILMGTPGASSTKDIYWDHLGNAQSTGKEWGSSG